MRNFVTSAKMGFRAFAKLDRRSPGARSEPRDHQTDHRTASSRLRSVHDLLKQSVHNIPMDKPDRNF